MDFSDEAAVFDKCLSIIRKVEEVRWHTMAKPEIAGPLKPDASHYWAYQRGVHCKARCDNLLPMQHSEGSSNMHVLACKSLNI